MLTPAATERASDSELWQRVRQGNAPAFESVVKRHQSLVCAVAYSSCGDLTLSEDNVAAVMRGGRARWKIENETFNVLKTKGYNIEHSFGHGKLHLAAILVTLNLLAFAIHTVCDIGDELWRSARQKLGSRSQFFNNLAAITTFLIFPSWQDLLQTLAFAKPPPVPP